MPLAAKPPAVAVSPPMRRNDQAREDASVPSSPSDRDDASLRLGHSDPPRYHIDMPGHPADWRPRAARRLARWLNHCTHACPPYHLRWSGNAGAMTMPSARYRGQRGRTDRRVLNDQRASHRHNLLAGGNSSCTANWPSRCRGSGCCSSHRRDPAVLS